MNSGIFISDLLNVEIYIYLISDSKEERQISWVRFCHQGWNVWIATVMNLITANFQICFFVKPPYWCPYPPVWLKVRPPSLHIYIISIQKNKQKNQNTQPNGNNFSTLCQTPFTITTRSLEGTLPHDPLWPVSRRLDFIWLPSSIFWTACTITVTIFKSILLIKTGYL